LGFNVEIYSKELSAKLASKYDYCLVYKAVGENLEVVTGRKGVSTFFIDIKGHDVNLEASYEL